MAETLVDEVPVQLGKPSVPATDNGAVQGSTNTAGTGDGMAAGGRATQGAVAGSAGAVADTLTANFGAAVNWNTAADASEWQGALQAGQTTSLAFSVRESELASTVKTPGAVGAVIIAVETEIADVNATLEVVGGTVLGTR